MSSLSVHAQHGRSKSVRGSNSSLRWGVVNVLVQHQSHRVGNYTQVMKELRPTFTPLETGAPPSTRPSGSRPLTASQRARSKAHLYRSSTPPYKQASVVAHSLLMAESYKRLLKKCARIGGSTLWTCHALGGCMC